MGRRTDAVARVVTMVAMGALLVPGLGHARIDHECGRGGRPIFAEITQPAGGSLTVVTGATGPIAVDAVGDGVVVSTTGEIPVTIDYSCIMELTLTITKEGPGDSYVADQHTWSDTDLNGDDLEGPCLEASVSRSMTIGLDGGNYSFTMSGTGCSGAPLTETTDGRVVGDPPLGI